MPLLKYRTWSALYEPMIDFDAWSHIKKKTRFPPSPLKELVLQNLPKGFNQLFSMIWTSSESFFNHFGMFYGWPKPDWTDRSQLDNLINLINKARFSISWMMTTRHSRYWLDSCSCTRMYVVANQLGFFNYVWDISIWSFPRGKTTLCSRQNLNGYHPVSTN